MRASIRIHLPVVLMLVVNLSSFGQKELQDDKKFSVGIFGSPGQIDYWFYDLNVNEGWSEPPKHLSATPYSPCGLSFGYKLNNSLQFQASIFPSKEEYSFSTILVETGGYNIDYHYTYLNIPIGLRIFPNNILNDEAKGGFFIQINSNFDLLLNENTLSRKNTWWYDPRHSYPAGYFDTINTVKTTSVVSSKIKFSRICPTLLFGQEMNAYNFSFFYGAYLEFVSVYQGKTPQEIFKNLKFSPLNTGLAYHF